MTKEVRDMIKNTVFVHPVDCKPNQIFVMGRKWTFTFESDAKLALQICNVFHEEIMRLAEWNERLEKVVDRYSERYDTH